MRRGGAQAKPRARPGSFTQQDPIGLAGGLNLYGFANGDPVNFSDPFGLRVTLPESEKIRAALRGLAGGSRAFQRMFSAMYRAPVSQIDVRVEGCTDTGCGEAVYHGGGFTYRRGPAVISSVDDETYSGDALMERVAHELVHAALSFGSRGRELTGVSCNQGEAEEACAERWHRTMMDEVSASRREQERKAAEPRSYKQ